MRGFSLLIKKGGAIVFLTKGGMSMRFKFVFFLMGITVLSVSSTSVIAQSAFSGNQGSPLIQKAPQKKIKTPDDVTFTRGQLGRWAQRQKINTKKYEGRVKDLIDHKGSVDNVVLTLRSLYPFTPYYDPIGQVTTEAMTRYAYISDTSKDPKEVNDALKAYRDLVFKHSANLGVVEYALTLSLVNARYGDEVLLRSLRDSLQKKARRGKRKGSTPDYAYKVISYDEETYILGVHNVTVQKSEIYHVGNKFYNVHDVIYNEDGRYSQLYFNVTAPIYLYKKTQALRDVLQKRAFPLQ